VVVCATLLWHMCGRWSWSLGHVWNCHWQLKIHYYKAQSMGHLVSKSNSVGCRSISFCHYRYSAWILKYLEIFWIRWRKWYSFAVCLFWCRSGRELYIWCACIKPHSRFNRAAWPVKCHSNWESQCTVWHRLAAPSRRWFCSCPLSNYRCCFCYLYSG